MDVSPNEQPESQRIVLVARSLQMGGVERNTVNLADTLAAMGHEVHILVMKNRREITPSPAVKVHVVDFEKINRYTIIGLVYDLLTRALLRPFLHRSTFLFRGLYGGLYFRLWLSRFERRIGPVDKIIARGQGSFENIWSFSDPRYFQVVVSPFGSKPSGTLRERLFTRAIYGGKQLVTNSSGTEDSLRERLEVCRVKPASIVRIPNPIPVERIQTLARQPAPLPEAPFIVHVARLTYQKNQELLIRAYHAAAVVEKLVIVGSGQDEAKLRKLCRELTIEDKVFFVGQQSNPYPWMKAARLFVLTSRFEGFGLVLVESLICGTPVVAADCPGGVRDVLIEEQARFIAPATVDGLALKIREALSMEICIKPEWYERYDAARIAENFLQLRPPLQTRG
ncbi:MAG: glycosyltransferase [Thiohalomonadaceae bacterium]